MTCSSEAPRTASMPSSRVPDARAISSPRRTARRSPEAGSSAPAATSALSSPSECPANAAGRTSASRLFQPAMLAQKIAGWANRVLSLTLANGSSPMSAMHSAKSSGTRRATSSRRELVWLPWPGKRPAMTLVDTPRRFAVRRRSGPCESARTAHVGGPFRAHGGVAFSDLASKQRALSDAGPSAARDVPHRRGCAPPACDRACWCAP